ncbi:hypothetical protein V6Z11_A11G121500 [Gossypium hirsutum]
MRALPLKLLIAILFSPIYIFLQFYIFLILSTKPFPYFHRELCLPCSFISITMLSRVSSSLRVQSDSRTIFLSTCFSANLGTRPIRFDGFLMDPVISVTPNCP